MNKNSRYTLGNTSNAVTVAIDAEGAALFRNFRGMAIDKKGKSIGGQIELGRPWHETKVFYDSLPGWDTIPSWVEFIAVDLNHDYNGIYLCNTNSRQVICGNFITSQEMTLGHPRIYDQHIANDRSFDDLEIKLSRQWYEMEKEKSSLIDWSKSPQWAIGHATLGKNSYWFDRRTMVNVNQSGSIDFESGKTYADHFKSYTLKPGLKAEIERPKLIYTVKMHERGELPPIGSFVEFIRETPFDIGKTVDHWDSGDQLEVVCHSKSFESLVNDIAVVRSSCGLSISLGSNYYRPINTPTNEQKAIDDLAAFESEHHEHRDYHLLLTNAIVNGEIFGLGGAGK